MTLSAEQRAAISRSNSKKSTGPRTEAGKAKSRANALKHGFRAAALPMPGEDPAHAAARSREWHDFYRPQSPAAQQLLDDCVRASLLSERVAAFQVATAEAQFERVCAEYRTAQEAEPLTETDTASHLAAAAALCLIPDDVNLARLYLRYQAEARTSFLRSWKALEAVLKSDAEASLGACDESESPHEATVGCGCGLVVETPAHADRGPQTDPSHAKAVPPNEPRPVAARPPNEPRPVAARPPNEPRPVAVAPPNEPRPVAARPPNEPRRVAVAPPNEPRSAAVAPPNEAKVVAAGWEALTPWSRKRDAKAVPA